MNLSSLSARVARLARRWRLWIIGVWTVLVAGVVWVEHGRGNSAVQRWESFAVDQWFSARAALMGRGEGHERVALVGVQTSTLERSGLAGVAGEHEALGLMAGQDYPWNRKVFALLLDRLFAEGAKVVALDFVFANPREGDEELAAALRRYRGRVVLAETWTMEDPNAEHPALVRLRPNAALIEAAGEDAVAFVAFKPDLNGVVRRYDERTSDLRLVGVEDPEAPMKGFAAAAVEKFSGRRVEDREGRLIDFQGRAATVRHLPIEEVFMERIFRNDPRFEGGKVFRDKVVFVGPLAEIFHDEHHTPYGAMPGVEIHAQLAGSMLAGRELTELPPLGQRLLALNAALAGAALLALRRSAWMQAASLLGVLGAYGAMVLGAFLFSDRVLPSLPLAMIAVVGVFGVSLDLVIEQGERRVMRSLLDQYVSKNVADVIVRQSDDFERSLRGERREVAVLFSDVRGFTTIFEQAEDSSAFTDQINEYFLEMVDVVLAEDGTLQKFIGDAIMAAWGDTHSSGGPTDTAHAVRAALRMRAALQRLNGLWVTTPRRVQFSIGIGINHGEVIFGRIGHPRRMELTILGDAVNAAARLESATKQYHTDILVSGRARELTADLFHYRLADVVKVKGKTQPIALYVPLSEVDEPAPGWLADYERAHELRLRRDFAGAEGLFEEVNAKLGGSDFLCQLHAERCRGFMQNAPAPEWDGSHTLTEK